MSDDVLFEIQNHVGIITLNKPQVLNALSRDMVIAINQTLVAWEKNANIKMVFVRAVPGRAFCAGGNLRDIYEQIKQHPVMIGDFFPDEYLLNQRIFHFPKPYVAWLDGITMGGGAGLSVHGSHRVVTSNLIFAMPETTIGFFPDVGTSYFLPRLPGKIGLYLGLTSTRINGDDAIAIGIGTHFCLPTMQDKVTQAFIACDFKEDALDCVDQILKKFTMPANVSLLQQQQQKIDHYFSKNSVGEIFHALTQTSDEWCQQTLATLKTKSPTSLKITFEELRRGAQYDFDACIQMELHLAKQCLQGHDFFEGVRSVIIDKDHDPHWQPNDLSAVSDAMVKNYFGE